MVEIHAPRLAGSDDETSFRFLVSAGTAYGVVFALSFALMAWGRDALLLASAEAHLAWLNLILGLPSALIICALAGRLTGSFSNAAVSVSAWTVAGVLLAMIAGHIPFEGRTLFVWLTEARLRGVSVFPFGDSAGARTGLLMIIGAGVGAAAGLLCQLAAEWAWDAASSQSRMSLKSWAVLFACIPLVFVFTWAVDDLINRPLRAPLRATSRLVTLVRAGAEEEAEAQGLSYSSVARYGERLAERYTLYPAAYDLDTLGRGYVDIAFDNGFTLRCLTVEKQVGYCAPIAERYREWMADLIHAGLHDDLPWADDRDRLVVDEAVLRWLRAQRDQLRETYSVAKGAQYGGLVLMNADFDTGSRLTCRFRGVNPAQVDDCWMARTSATP